MAVTSIPTMLDVVYTVLAGSDRPLTPAEIETVAVRSGYDVSAWEAVDEIEAHLDAYGPDSPFIQVGRQKYWLYSEHDGGAQPITSLPLHLPLMSAMVLLTMAVFIWMVFSGVAVTDFSTPAASLPVEAASVPAPLVEPAVEAVAKPSLTIDPAWWSANAVNQLNNDTQSVSRIFLSNFYNTCGPAAMSMVATFYRSQPGGDGSRVTPADVLRDARNLLGYFVPPYNSGLLNFKNLDALAGLYGLERSNPQGGGVLLSIEDLLQGVRDGAPAIAGVRYGYVGDRYVPVGGSGIYNHFVIVFGTQLVDGQEQLLVLNNHPGKYLMEDTDVQPELMSLEQFQQSWLLNDGSEDQGYGPAAFYKPAQ